MFWTIIRWSGTVVVLILLGIAVLQQNSTTSSSSRPATGAPNPLSDFRLK